MAALLKKNGITPIFFTICPINLTINPAFRETNAYIRENVAHKVKKADLSGKPMSDGISPSSETFNRSYGRLDAGRYPNRNLYREEVYVCRAVRSPSLGKLEVGFLKSRFSKYHTSEGMQLVGCFGPEYWKTVFPVTPHSPRQ